MTIERPEEDEVLVDRPWSGNPHQIINDMSEALETLMARWGVEGLRVMISVYEEEVEPGDLPTNDFMHAVKKDLDTHGKLILRCDPLPAPEGYVRNRDYQTLCTAALRHQETGETLLRTFWMCQQAHEMIVKFAEATLEKESN